MEDREPRFKIGIIIFLIVALIMAFIVIPRFIKLQHEEKELLEETTSTEESLRPLETEKAKIEAKLKELDETNVKYDISMSSTVFLITEPDERVMDDIVPVLSEKGYKGVLCINEEKFPGEKGMMSLSDAKDLVSNGWEIAILTEKDTDLYSSYFAIKGAGLGYAEAMYISDCELTDYMISESNDLLIPMIIQHRNDDPNGDETHYYISTIGASERENKKLYEQAVSYSKPIAISLGYTKDIDLFTENKLKNILISVDDAKTQNSTEICNIKGTIDRIKELEEKITSGETETVDERTELENRLKEIEAEIEALNEE